MKPSVKGILVVGVVVAVRRLRDRGGVSKQQLAARLGGEALELLDQKIDLGRWYPMQDFCELLDLEWEVAGNRDPAYMIQAGVLTADRVFDRGIYQQLDYAERAERAHSPEDVLRRARLITTITSSFYDFLEVQVRLDPENPRLLEIRYANAAAYSEALRYTTEGFMNQINRRFGSSRCWTGLRPRPDLVVFQLPLPESFSPSS